MLTVHVMGTPMSKIKLVCLECGQTNAIPSGRLDDGAKCGTCGASLLAGRTHDVDPAFLAKAVRTDDLPILVDFWAPWCGPCRMMAPEFSQAAVALRGRVRLAKVNTQVHDHAGARYAIRGIPTIVLFAGGKERERRSGAMPSDDIVALAESVV